MANKSVKTSDFLRLRFNVSDKDVFPDNRKSYAIELTKKLLQSNIEQFVKQKQKDLLNIMQPIFNEELRSEMALRNQVATGKTINTSKLYIEEIFFRDGFTLFLNVKSLKDRFDYYGWHGRKFTKFDAILNWVKARGFDGIYNKRYKSYNNKSKEEIQRRIAFAIRFSKNDSLRSNIYEKESGESETIIKKVNARDGLS